MTNYSDDAVRVTGDTDPVELRAFAVRRAKNPIQRKGVTTWNFSTHEPAWEALNEKLSMVYQQRMVIPYQVPGVWAYFNAFLPSGITKCDYLVYSQRDEEYKAFKNLTRADDEVEMRKTHEELTEWLEMYER